MKMKKDNWYKTRTGKLVKVIEYLNNEVDAGNVSRVEGTCTPGNSYPGIVYEHGFGGTYTISEKGECFIGIATDNDLIKHLSKDEYPYLYL